MINGVWHVFSKLLLGYDDSDFNKKDILNQQIKKRYYKKSYRIEYLKI